MKEYEEEKKQEEKHCPSDPTGQGAHVEAAEGGGHGARALRRGHAAGYGLVDVARHIKEEEEEEEAEEAQGRRRRGRRRRRRRRRRSRRKRKRGGYMGERGGGEDGAAGGRREMREKRRALPLARMPVAAEGATPSPRPTRKRESSRALKENCAHMGAIRVPKDHSMTPPNSTTLPPYFCASQPPCFRAETRPLFGKITISGDGVVFGFEPKPFAAQLAGSLTHLAVIPAHMNVHALRSQTSQIKWRQPPKVSTANATKPHLCI